MRRGEQHIALTLWPFLDILSCLAGALTVIIATVLVTQMVEDPAVSNPINQKLAQTAKENAWKRTQIARYQDYIKDAEDKRAVLQKARESYLETQEDVEIQLRWQGVVISLMRQKEEIQRQIRQLREQYARQAAEMEKSRPVNQGTPGPNVSDRIEVHFTGRGKDLKPVFVECTGEGIIIRAGRDSSFVRIQNITASDDYRRILQQVQETMGGTLIFLIRPSGIDAFNQAEAFAEQAGVRNGKLPIPGDGVIDLGPYTAQGAVMP